MSAIATSPLQKIQEEGKHFKALARQKQLGHENLHQLWCPSLRMSNSNGKLHEAEILEGFISAVREIGRNRYVVAVRNKNMRAYPLLRYYKVGYDRKNLNETESLALILDSPGQSGCIPPQGSNILGKIMPDFEDGESRTTTGNAMVRVTPLGKKGIAMMHTMNQVCPLKAVRGGPFQRFLLAPNILMSIRRTALSLRLLAGADPKTLEDGYRTLEAEIMEQLPRLAGVAGDHLESLRVNHLYLDLNQLTKTFARNLPCLSIAGVEIRVCHERIHGPDPRTWTMSIQSQHKDATETENQTRFQNVWKELTA